MGVPPLEDGKDQLIVMIFAPPVADMLAGALGREKEEAEAVDDFGPSPATVTADTL